MSCRFSLTMDLAIHRIDVFVAYDLRPLTIPVSHKVETFPWIR